MEMEIALSKVTEPQLFVTFFPIGLVCSSRGYRIESFGIYHNHSAYCCRKRTENVGFNHSLCDFKPVIPGPLITQSIMNHMWDVLWGNQW